MAFPSPSSSSPPRPKKDVMRPPAKSPAPKGAIKKVVNTASLAKDPSVPPKTKMGTSTAKKDGTGVSPGAKKPVSSSSNKPRSTSSSPSSGAQSTPDMPQDSSSDQQQPGGDQQYGQHPTHAVNISVQTGASPHMGMAKTGPVMAKHGLSAQPAGQQPQDMGQQAPGQDSSSGNTQPKTGVKDLPKGPKKASTPPKDVQQARKTQSTVLKARQQKEIRGKNRGPVRDMDPGAGSWPPLSPML